MHTVRELNDENVGTEEERMAAIARRCKEAGYEVTREQMGLGPTPDSPIEWRHSAVR
jgi:hypothetical protein